MKKFLSLSPLLIMIIFLFAACSSEGYVVRQRPVEPVYAATAPPYAGAVLVPGEWVWRSNNYVYIQPHYVQPGRRHVYVQGHWDARPRGFVWRKGHWR